MADGDIFIAGRGRVGCDDQSRLLLLACCWLLAVLLGPTWGSWLDCLASGFWGLGMGMLGWMGDRRSLVPRGSEPEIIEVVLIYRHYCLYMRILPALPSC